MGEKKNILQTEFHNTDNICFVVSFTQSIWALTTPLSHFSCNSRFKAAEFKLFSIQILKENY